MSATHQSTHLYPTRLDIPLEIRLFLITLLHQTLACSLDLRSQVKQAAWNMKGKDAAMLHTLCTTMAAELEAYADMVAERIAILGGEVLGTVRTVAAYSTLPEYPGAIVEGHAHALVLAEHLGYYTKAVREAITCATDVEEAGTAAIYTDISLRVDKQLWVLETYLHQ